MSSSRSRRALVQPRFLVAAMTVAVGGVTYLATAQTGRAPVAMTAASTSSSSTTKGPVSLADLPAMVAAYGEGRQKQATSQLPLGAQAIGTGQSGYTLVESDLTSNTPSDEREPVLSPGGDYIAFTSNGKDTDKNGKIDSDAINTENKTHVWVMNRDGSNQRQITGLYADKTRNQTHPAWSPDGNQLVFIDGDGATSQLYVAEPLINGVAPTDTPDASVRLTFFGGTKKSPAWSPSGLNIIFACDANLDSDAGATAGQYDLFSVAANGASDSILRLTGGTDDPVGNNTQDLNPAFSAVNLGVLYWSSNRTTAGALTTGRRIWQMNSDGSDFIQISDPTKRAAGTVNDQDDYPTASLPAGLSERVAFQSNSYIDASDTTHDLNIWTLAHSTASAGTPFQETEPRVFISDFNGNRVVSMNPVTGAQSATNQVIDGLNHPEGVLVRGQYLYIANRGTGQLLRYNPETGAAAGTGVFANFTAAASVPECTGLATDGFYFYVGAGTGKNAIYRFDNGGNPAPYAGGTAGSAIFSNGDTDAAAAVTGTEGIAISPDDQYLFVSCVTDNKINVYDKDTGQYITTFANKTTTPTLLIPTGLEFGPDLNGDGYKDLYVNASSSDSVLAFMGPKPGVDIRVNNVGDGTQAPGTFIGTIVQDNAGTATNLNAPEGIRIISESDTGKTHLFVSSFENRNSPNGDHVNRYTLDVAAKTATAEPRNAFNKPNATYITVPANGTIGLGYFDFNGLGNAAMGISTNVVVPTNTPVPPTAAAETTNSASVVTNGLSSPNNYNASGLKPSAAAAAAGATDVVGEDKANDREPAYSRTGTSPELAARAVFASNRQYAPSPSSNAVDSNGNKPAPSNPYGVNGDGGTHDIWGATVQDTTPPVLIPQSQGNQLYPFVAPSPDAPFSAPRTYEQGLRKGGPLKVACVFSDNESGLNLANGSNSVRVSIYRAGQEKFTTSTSRTNEAVTVRIAKETLANVEATATLQPYDDGPASAGGHELQAGAVAGDGIFYCAATLTTPASAGDFYISVTASDQVGNSFTYDNVWGFSTQEFKPISATSTLFVSDYTIGQTFPRTLLGNNDLRFVGMVPTEGNYLTNPGGQALDDKGAVTAVAVSRTFNPATTDVWRTLSRGPITSTILNSYRPTTTDQIDPFETTPGKDGPYTEKSRQLTVAKTAIVWAAPFAGTVFSGPGTITDAEVQTRLKDYLQSGGRLFITGRDVAWALSNNGKNSNDFLENELGAKFGGETQNNQIDVRDGNRNNGYNPMYNPPNDAGVNQDYYSLEIPHHNDNPQDNTYEDAALTQNPNTGIGASMDIITPNANGATLTTNYLAGGNIVGQTVVKTRSSAIQSRVVFFSFGFEAVNRRYRKITGPTDPFQRISLDTRSRVADGILSSFRTTTITGTVINDKTNNPIPNFLVSIPGGPNGVYLARTDEKGQYTLSGVYGAGNVTPAYLLNGKLSAEGVPGAETSPPGYFGGEAINYDLRVIPFSPGSLNGRIVSSQGTPTDFTDDVTDDKSYNVPVLVRSVNESSSVVGGGHFAKLTKTNNKGEFSFSDIPTRTDVQVVFNPTVEDIPAESGLRASYSGQLTTIGRRVIPDNRRPDTLQVPSGDNYTVNDPDPTKYPDPDSGPTANGPDGDTKADSGQPIVVPLGPSIRGVVTLNGAIAPGATVELLDSTGASLPAPRSKVTGADGSYIFADVAPGDYKLRGTASTTDGVSASTTVSVSVVQGADTQKNIPINLYKVSGKVTLNGASAGAGVTVQLYNNDNTAFTPARKTTTDASGSYVLTNIPNGKFKVRAVQNQSSGSVAISVADADVNAPAIALINQQLSGQIFLSIDGTTAKPLAGAAVELVTSGNKSLNPKVTTTSDKNGNYSFTDTKSGKYRIRASYGGDTNNSNFFEVNSPSTIGPDVTLALQNLTVKVIDARKKLISGASLMLMQGSTVLQQGTTDTTGAAKFTFIPAGSYVVTATKGNLGGQADVNIKRQVKPGVLTVVLQGDTSGSTNPTGFNVKGKIYLISIPYQDTNSPASSNVSERTGNVPAATTKVKAAFTIPPVDPTTGQVNYLLQRFDPVSLTYVDLDANSTIVRGVGYLLQVVNKGTQIVLPKINPSRIALTDAATEKTFTVTLHMNPSIAGNRDNGRNLIGFGFNPDKFKSVDWTKVIVTNPNGQVANSLQEAVDNGWLKSQASTLDSSGATPKTVDVTALKPYGGYFVQTNVDGLKVTFRSPTK